MESDKDITVTQVTSLNLASETDDEDNNYELLNDNSADDKPVPPDGGWGWVICFTAMAAYGTVFGILNTFGILYKAMRKQYAKGDSNISFKTAWVGSVCLGLTHFMCLTSSVVNDILGIRLTAIGGALIATGGLVGSAFVEDLMLLYLTFGIILGTGFAACFIPAMNILGHYFQRRLGLVNGIVTFGASILTAILSFVLPRLLESISLKYTLLTLAGFTFLLVPFSFTWKPILRRKNLLGGKGKMSGSTGGELDNEIRCGSLLPGQYLKLSIWRNKSYRIWALSTGVCAIGTFVPFVHSVKLAEDRFPADDGSVLLMYMSITSALSRLVTGKISDFGWMSRIRLQQLAYGLLGVCIVCAPFSPTFGFLIGVFLILGLTDGAVTCLHNPIAFDIAGERDAAQALGFLNATLAIPLIVGPPLAGALYDNLGSYDVAFPVAGGFCILGALIMFFIRNTEGIRSVQEVEVEMAETPLRSGSNSTSVG